MKPPYKSEDGEQPGPFLVNPILEKWKGMNFLPKKSVLYGKKQDLVKTFLSRNQPRDSSCSPTLKKPSVCSYSVYKYLLSSLKVQTVHCAVTPRFRNLQDMSSHLVSMEVLSADADAFIKEETGWQRLIRYFTPDPYTGQFPGNHMQFLKGSMIMIVIAAIYGFGMGALTNYNHFKKMNKLTYLERRFESERIMQLFLVGSKSGTRLAWIGTRLFVPMYLVTVGLTIFANTSNPIIFSLGFSAGVILNRKIIPTERSFYQILARANVFGLIMGTAMYFFLRSNNQTQETINLETVKRKLCNENPAKYTGSK